MEKIEVKKQPNVNTSSNYIKTGAIMRLGLDVAQVICDGYASDSAEKKLEFIDKIRKTDISQETKLKFIGDIIVRAKKERIAISRSLQRMIEEKKEEA